jgi:hypothetical protein
LIAKATPHRVTKNDGSIQLTGKMTEKFVHYSRGGRDLGKKCGLGQNIAILPETLAGGAGIARALAHNG